MWHYIHHMLNALFHIKILHYKDIKIKVILNIIFVLRLSILFILIKINSVFFLLFVILLPFTLWAAAIFLPLYYTIHLLVSNPITVWILFLFDKKNFRNKQMSSGKKNRMVHCSHQARLLVASWYPSGIKLIK